MKTNIQYKTKDGYELKIGTKIYYTGDQANIPGYLTITNIKEDKWGNHFELVEDEMPIYEEAPRKMFLSISSFEPGSGRRFLPLELHNKIREEKINQLREYLAKGK